MNFLSSFRLRLSAAGTLLMAFIVPAAAADPAWWNASETKIWDSSPQSNQNWSPINAGQLKNVATKAKRFLDVTLTVGSGSSVDAICQFSNLGNYAPVNVGQLKNVAKPFYDRLAQIGFNWQTGAAGVPSSLYPWDQTTSPENEMPANLGQLKNVFSFDLGDAFVKSDADADGMPSWWETLYGLNPGSSADAEADSDGDGQSNFKELQLGTDPTVKDTFVSYGSTYADVIALQPGSPMTFQSLGTASYVSYGILAYDQPVRYGRDKADGTVQLNVWLKRGTSVKFFYAGSTPNSPGYVSSGTLSERAAPQALAYGLHGSGGGYATKLNFKPGTVINFKHNPANSIACGYVLNGTVAETQGVYYGYKNNADSAVTVAAGSVCTFAHFPTNGPAMSGYLQYGIVGADSIVPYSWIQSGTEPSVKIKAGTVVSFQHYKLGGSAANGYVKSGTLAENTSVMYSSASSITAASGTAVEFAFIPLSTYYAAYGYISKCIPAVDSPVRYGSQTNPDASIMTKAGKPAIFTQVGSGSSNVGYLNSGTLAALGPVSLPYSFSPIYYANFAAGKEVSFIRRSDNNQGCVSSGFLEDASGSQLIYPKSDSTTSQSATNGSLLGVSITSTGSPPVTKAYVRTPAPLDDDHDGFTNAEESQLGTNPLVPDNFQRDGDLNSQPDDIRNKTLVVVGDGETGKTISASKPVTIDPGDSTWLVVLAIKSAEFPEWTRDSSQYDDTVKATISGTLNVSEPAIHVNALHQEWLNACKLGSGPASFLGYGPIYTKILGSVQAVPTSEKSISFKLDVTNVSDGKLPTTAILSLIPVEVAVRAKGTAAAPDTGLAVKNGDVLEIALAPPFFGLEKQMETNISWEFAQLKGDGSYTQWTPFGGNGTGSVFEYIATNSGIFKLRAVLAQTGTTQLYDYLRKKDALFATNSSGVTNDKLTKGKPDFFGVADTDIQLTVRYQALINLGSGAYAKSSSHAPVGFGVDSTLDFKDSWKCNIFVFRMANIARAIVPTKNWRDYQFGLPPYIDRAVPPGANDWYNSSYSIGSWSWKVSSTTPQPGDTAVHQHTSIQIGGAAHIGIVDYDGSWINAGKNNVNKSIHVSDADYQPTNFRRYIGTSP